MPQKNTKWSATDTHYVTSLKSKGKVFPYSLPSIGPGADPDVPAVSPQVTLSHPSGGRLPLLFARPVTCRAFIHQMATHDSTHPIPAYYSFIYSERTKGWVGLVGWPVADGLPTIVVTHQLQVEHRTEKVRWPETGVLPLCYVTNRI